MISNDTICALATAQGVGAIAVIRLSGSQAIPITSKVFKGKNLADVPSHTVHYGHILDGTRVIDEVMVSVFHSPKSFTTEDVVEISCHGSVYIAEQILHLLMKNGARSAKPGEFTLRAFMNGRIDLAQAEAVADMIASNSAASLDLAIKQMRGGFSHQLKSLRTELVNFASLLELELDFAEEDVEFANRVQLISLIQKIQLLLAPLIDSFKMGNVMKNGVNTVIVGKPNAGKSTLLNALLNEERAIVSEIAGTTRDSIEETLNVQGIVFRFIDTAGLRKTDDVIERIGVERSYDKIKDAAVLLYVCDASALTDVHTLIDEINEVEKFGVPYLFIANKADLLPENLHEQIEQTKSCVMISAKNKTGINDLKNALFQAIVKDGIKEDQTVVTNLRHYQSLMNANLSLTDVVTGIDQHISSELIALDIRKALESLGEITGEVSNDEILGTIFSKFCIGK